MKFYRLLLIIPLMILLGCNDYSLQDPFKGPNGLWGYKDGDGKIRVKAKYQKADSFSGNFARVNDGWWGFINKQGKEVVPLKYDDVDYFYDGLAIVQLNGKWGFVDETGKEVIELKYDGVQGFHTSLAAVKLDGKWGLVNKKGKEIIPPKYDYVMRFSMDGRVLPGYRVKLNGNWALLDGTLTEYWDMTEDQFREYIKQLNKN